MRVLGIFNQMNLVLRQEQEFLTTFLPIKYKRKQHLQKKYHLSTHAHHLESEFYVVEMIKYFLQISKTRNLIFNVRYFFASFSINLQIFIFIFRER